MGDEADFIELVIASERAHEWAKLLRDPTTPHARLQQCVEELHRLVLSRPAYLEEAREAGIVKILTNLIKKRDDTDDALTPLFAKALAACCGHAAVGKRIHTYDYEGYSVTIQEGLLGEGLGCKVWAVAHILCRRLVRAPALVKGKSVLEIGAGCGVCGILAANLGASSVVLADCEPAVLRNLARCLALNPECFDVILGTDVLYEDPMAPLVSAVLKHRLAPGGKAYVCCAVREQRIFDQFASKLEEHGLSCETEAVWPDKRDPGLFGRENFYEGNFVLMTIANSP